MVSSHIHFVANDRISFLSMVEWYSFVCICTFYLVFTWWPSGLIHILAVVIWAAINIRVQIALRYTHFLHLSKISGVEWLCHMAHLFWGFWRIPLLSFTMARLFYILTSCVLEPLWLVFEFWKLIILIWDHAGRWWLAWEHSVCLLPSCVSWAL